MILSQVGTWLLQQNITFRPVIFYLEGPWNAAPHIEAKFFSKLHSFECVTVRNKRMPVVKLDPFLTAWLKLSKKLRIMCLGLIITTVHTSHLDQNKAELSPVSLLSPLESHAVFNSFWIVLTRYLKIKREIVWAL